jgi:hydrogenase-4 component E
MLHRALREAAIKREIEPFISYVASLLLCAAGTGAAVLFAGELPLAPEHVGSLLVPASLATVFSGFLVLTTRLKAITQVVGYLILENGIFIMGLSLHGAMPFLVEIGVLLDLLVAVFVIGIVINHINRAFAQVDPSRLDTLKEE